MNSFVISTTLSNLSNLRWDEMRREEMGWDEMRREEMGRDEKRKYSTKSKSLKQKFKADFVYFLVDIKNIGDRSFQMDYNVVFSLKNSFNRITDLKSISI